MNEVQALILNLSFPNSFDEIIELKSNGGKFNVEWIVAHNNNEKYGWTSPKWIKPNDIIFFMHSRTSVQKISKLKRKLESEKELWSEHYTLLYNALDTGLKIYSKYGGKIFAIGQYIDKPFYDNPSEDEFLRHWRSTIYAYVDNYYVLNTPIDLSEFKSFITLSQGGSITPVYGREFEQLKDLIASQNTIPLYLKNSIAMPIPFMKINDRNWIDITSKYRHHFIYEIQFRQFYVDFFLKILGDRKKIYKECACEKKGHHTSYVDNIIHFNNCYLPVEVKLSITSEHNLEKQLAKYCNLDMFYLDRNKKIKGPIEKIIKNNVLVIDTTSVYIYSDIDKSIYECCKLDTISTNEDILYLRNTLCKRLQNIN